ncbi:MAG: hypothetical protein ABI574_06545 [Burkholderiales bacterium]
MPHLLRPLHAAVIAAALLSPFAASAGEVYANLGLPGLGLGYAHALNNSVTLRGDFSTLGNHSKNRNEQGVDYLVTGKLNRFGLFADWFVLGGGFRLTGGITSNDFKVDLLAQGNGQQMTVGSNTFTTAPDDRLNVKIRFPRTTPYLGIGYGHQLSQGVGFVFDLGASIGKATVSETHSGTNLGDPNRVSQADIDAELAQLRNGVGKVKALPQVSIGLAVRF